jgi:hypothetical protein
MRVGTDKFKFDQPYEIRVIEIAKTQRSSALMRLQEESTIPVPINKAYFLRK